MTTNVNPRTSRTRTSRTRTDSERTTRPLGTLGLFEADGDISPLASFEPATPLPSSLKWGKMPLGLFTEKLDEIYNEMVHWKKNLFYIPHGNASKHLTEELSRILRFFTTKSNLESIAIKAYRVLLCTVLQKPSPKSKPRDHLKYLEKRIKWWKEGELELLFRECKAIQAELTKTQRRQPNRAKIFAKLVLQGKLSAALRILTGDQDTSVLGPTESVIEQLRMLHPNPEDADITGLIRGVPPVIDPVVYQNIDGTSIYKAAMRTRGSSGPSGMDADNMRKLLCSKKHKRASEELCEAIADMGKRIGTEYLDPGLLDTYINCREIALEKPTGGIRPIGIGEIIRRIIGKAIATHFSTDIVKAAGSQQTCAGHPGGIGAAIHAAADYFETDECEGLLQIDARNAFNCLNRQSALHNIRCICPKIAIYLINTYRKSARLILGENQEILSQEGTTQGDNLAMAFYALSVKRLIRALNDVDCLQEWFADDAAALGKLVALRAWWDRLRILGPKYGYFPKPSKCWLIVKEDVLAQARQIFENTGINITDEGQRHLGAAIGKRDFIKSFVHEKVKEWVQEINNLDKAATEEPHLAYFVYTRILQNKWLFVLRTIKGIAEHLHPLEEAIRGFCNTITSRHLTDDERRVLELPCNVGGLGILNPIDEADRQYQNSRALSDRLCKAILAKEDLVNYGNGDVMKQIKSHNVENHRLKRDGIYENSSTEIKRCLDLLQPKGTSIWLTSYPSTEHDLYFNKEEFTDAICLRYKWPVRNLPRICECGAANDPDHAMICSLGGFVIMRHNTIRDLEAEFLGTICKDVAIEPPLLPVSDAHLLPSSANSDENARLDVSCRGFWGPLRRAFFDVRVTHPDANSQRARALEAILKTNELSKKREYNDRVIQVEHAYFTPLVFATNGAMGKEAARFHQLLAEKMSDKINCTYAETIHYIRKRLSASIIKSALIALRGRRRRQQQAPTAIADIDIKLAYFNC
jgi:hypothetical protein